MRGTKAKALYRAALEQAAKADGTAEQFKAFYRHLKGRPQKRTGLNEPKINLIQYATGRVNPDGTNEMAQAVKWMYQPISATLYNARQTNRCQDRSKVYDK